jgi:hypothetical protein
LPWNLFGDFVLKIARRILLVLSCLSGVIFNLAVNAAGAIGFIMNGYEPVGAALFISIPLLIVAFILCVKKFSVLPAIFNIIGSGFYLYSIAAVYAIPNDVVKKIYTEKLAENHLPSVIFSILLLALCVINFLLPENAAKRMMRKRVTERALNDDEKIM